MSLRRRFNSDAPASERWKAISFASDVDPVLCIDLLLTAVGDNNDSIRRNARIVLEEQSDLIPLVFNDLSDLERLKVHLRSADREVRMATVRVFGLCLKDFPAATPCLIEALFDPSAAVREAAGTSLHMLPVTNLAKLLLNWVETSIPMGEVDYTSAQTRIGHAALFLYTEDLGCALERHVDEVFLPSSPHKRLLISALEKCQESIPKISLNEFFGFHTGVHESLMVNPVPGFMHRHSWLKNQTTIDPRHTCALHTNRNVDYGMHFLSPHDLIHTSVYPVLNHSPWVLSVDFIEWPYLMNDQEFQSAIDGVGPFTSFIQTDEHQKRLDRFGKLLGSRHCKKILPWSRWCEKRIKSVFATSQIQNKVEVVYPAIKPRPFIDRENKSGSTRILFVGRNYRRKGGDIVLRAYTELRKHYDVDLTLITDMNSVSRKAFAGYEDDVNIYLPGLVSNIQMQSHYEQADLFVLPSHLESFGVSIIEAMSFSLPVIVCNGCRLPAMPEIVEDGASGIMVPRTHGDEHPNFAGSLDFDCFVSALATLVEQKDTRLQMGLCGHRIVADRFSSKRRNEQLRRIYKEALD